MGWSECLWVDHRVFFQYLKALYITYIKPYTFTWPKSFLLISRLCYIDMVIRFCVIFKAISHQYCQISIWKIFLSVFKVIAKKDYNFTLVTFRSKGQRSICSSNGYLLQMLFSHVYWFETLSFSFFLNLTFFKKNSYTSYHKHMPRNGPHRLIDWGFGFKTPDFNFFYFYPCQMLTCISKNEEMTIENIYFNQNMSKSYSFNALLLINIVHQSFDKIITLCLKVIKKKSNKQTKTKQFTAIKL